MADTPIAPELFTETVEPTQFAATPKDDGFTAQPNFKPIKFKKQTAKEILSHTDKDDQSAKATIAVYLNNRYKENVDDVLLNYDVVSKHYNFSGNPMTDVAAIRAGEHDIENQISSMSLNPDAEKQYAQDTSSTWSDFKNSLDVGFLSDFVGASVQGAAKGLEMMKDPYAGITDTPEGTPESATFTEDRESGEIDFVDKSKVPAKKPLVSSEGVRQWRKEVEERNTISPGFAESFGGQVTRAFGQAGGIPVYMVAAPVGVGMSVAQAYQFGEDNYRDHAELNDIPFDELEARRAGLWNMPSAALDIIGDKFVVGKILRKAGKDLSPSKLYQFGRDLIQSGAMGGSTEAAQEMWENFNAKYLSGYNPEAKITEGAWTAFKIGVIVDAGTTTAGKGAKSAVDKSLDKWFHPIKGMSPQDMGAAFSTVTDEEFEKWNKKAYGKRKDAEGMPLQELARAARQKDRAAAEALKKSQTQEKAEDDADGVTEAERKAADEKDERETESEEYADPFEEISQEDAAIQSKRDAIETAKVFIDENPELEVVKSGNMAKIIARFESEIAELEAQVAAEAEVKEETDPNARPEDAQAAQAADEATREKADVVAAIADYLSQTFLPGSEMENAPGTIRSFQADLNTMLRSGMPKAAVQRFAENAIKAAGLPAGTDPRRLTIDGVQQSKIKRDGTYISKIKIFQTADPLTVFEEVAHDYTDRKVAEQVYDYVDHYRPWVDLIDGKGASQEMTDREVKERLADFAKAYAITKSKDVDAMMPTSFRTWLNGMLIEIRKYLEIAAKIRTLRRNGMLDKEFEAFLDRSLGLDDAELGRYHNEQQAKETAPDPKDELLKVIKRLGGVPRPDSDPTFRGELETYFESIGKRWKSLRKGGNLDGLREGLQSAGFAVDAASDVLDLLDRSSRGEEIFPNQDSRSAAAATEGASFSLAPVTPEQDTAYLAAVESGDTETQQAMVDEAAKAAGYDSPKVFHKTNADFDEFSKEKVGQNMGMNRFGLKGFNFAYKPAWKGSRVISAYLKLGEKFDGGVQGSDSDFQGSYSDWAGNSKMIVVKNPEQIKSADPVTYDSNGDPIPLSERFNEADPRISYSLAAIEEDGAPIPEGWYVHGRNPDKGFGDTGIAMATRSIETARQYAGTDGDIYALNGNDLIDIDDEVEMLKITDALEVDYESGTLPLDVEEWVSQAKENGEDLSEMIAVPDLVEDGGAWDLNGFTYWIWERFNVDGYKVGDEEAVWVNASESEHVNLSEGGELPAKAPSYSLAEIDAEAEAQAEAEKARKESEHKTPTEQKYEKAQADFDANPDEQSDKAFEALILLKEKARKSREGYDLRKSYEYKKKAPAMKKVDKILSGRKTFEDVRVTLRKLEEVVRGLHPNLRTRFTGFESPAGYNIKESDRINFLERQKQRVQDVFDREKYYSDRRAARKRWQSWNKNIDEARAGRKKLNVANGEAVSKFVKDHLPLTPEARKVIEDRIDEINDDIFQSLNGVTVGDEKAVTEARAKVAESQTELEGLQQRLGRAKFWSNKVGASQIEMFERDLRSLIKTGRTEFEIRKEKQQAQVKSDATAIKAEIQASIKSGKNLNQALAESLGKRADEGFNTIKTKGRPRAELEKFITAHLRPETQMDLMTGEADNSLIEFIFNRMADAEYAYQAAMQSNSDIIKDEVVGDASFDPKQILLAGTSLTADRAMAIYAYSQSAAGRAHLQSTMFEGVLLTDDVVDQLLQGLPAELKAVVDRAMIFLDTTIYPKINQTFLGQFGVELPRSNNYFPIQGLDRDTSIEDILNDYGHARAVGRGMTKGRVKSELPFESLNFTETFFNAVSRGERYSNMSDAHAQARSTMEYKDVTRAENGDVESVNWEMQRVMKTRSDAMTDSLNGWMARVALGRAAPSDTGFLSFLGKLRRNLATGWLAYNPKTVITQTLSVSPAIGMATDKAEMVAYLTKYGSSIDEATEAVDFANRNSQMMKTRGDNISTALTELMETKAVARAFNIESRLSEIKEKGFIPMQKFDKYLSVGIWTAEYKTVSNRALSAGKKPDDAHAAGVAAGDKIVRTTQSTADVINSAEIMMSSNQILRTFVMFRTDINQTMNNMISDFQLSKTGEEKVKSISNSAAWMVLLPAIMLASIAAIAEETAELLKLKDDDDDKGEDLENWGKAIASESVGQTVGSLIFVGDIVKGIADKAVDSDKAMFANDINSPVMSVAGDLASLDRRSFKAILLGSGVPLSKYIADADEIIERWWNALN